jgi:cell division protein FtsZ
MEQLILRVAARAGRNRALSGKSSGPGQGRLLVVGVGSAGCAAADWVYEETPGASTLAVNTDRMSLEIHKSDAKLLLGERIFGGKGAQGHADAARRAANESRSEIERLVAGFDIVAVLTGLGGGTGTGAAAVVARAARAQGAAVVAVAAIPMRVERTRRERALGALGDLRREAHTTILLDHEAMLPIAGNLPMGTALGVMDCFMAEVPRVLARHAQIADEPGAAQAEAKALVEAGGLGTLVYGEWREDGAHARADHALVEPAGGTPNLAIIHITSADGRAPLGTDALAGKIAGRLKSEAVPQERVRITVGTDPAVKAGGTLVSVVTGIADPHQGGAGAPAVVLEPTRVVAGPAAPPAREVEHAPAATHAAQVHDVALRSP